MIYNKLILIAILFIFGSNVFPQTSEFPKIMYVDSKEGLRIREEPSLNSNRIGAALHGERIRVYEKTNVPVTIDGIAGYWYRTDGRYIDGIWYRNAWVFGGYLSEQLPKDAPVILGYWDDIGNDRNYYYFRPDHTYSEGYKETDMGLMGTWSLNNNLLTIIITGPLMDDFDGTGKHKSETVIINLTINDRNDIILNYPNGKTIKLRRNNGLI
jgi:hypothetical protein